MKTKTKDLNKKLLLNKETISLLTNLQQRKVVGGNADYPTTITTITTTSEPTGDRRTTGQSYQSYQ